MSKWQKDGFGQNESMKLRLSHHNFSGKILE